jgi:glutamate-ammonia-ligase adenylyltransferase
MSVPPIRTCLDQQSAAASWLQGLGIADTRRAHGNLLGMAAAGLTLDLLAVIFEQLDRHLPACADADMALDNLERFVRAARNPLALGTLFQRDPRTLPTLLQIFAASRHLSDLLATDTAALDLLRLSEGGETARQTLVNELCAEIDALEHEAAVLRALRRFKRRETLRIAYGDIVRGRSLRAVAMQISFLADALLEAALRAARRKYSALRGTPRTRDGEPARFVVLALGKLGGLELNYSSDVDLMFICEGDGRTDGQRPVSNVEYFELVGRELVRLLTEKTELGGVYRVDMRLRPEGSRGPMVMDVAAARAYYDTRGRTWERQALIKARPAAGDLDLGREFLDALKPWIFRRYLTHADISGIRALKRRIERMASSAGGWRDVKTGGGGIRDIEFVIQFLQLLNGGDLPQLHTGNTLEALVQLERVGCLTDLERSLLEENYVFLRKIEHRLQIMLDMRTHLLPDDGGELRKLALRMGYANGSDHPVAETFLADYRRRTGLNRKILDHLLHDAFSDDRQTSAEVELVLDPDPPTERIDEVLGKYRFRDPRRAYGLLNSLGEERIRFLSARRCRHFLASIAPQLLSAIAETADPDSTLSNLDKVSDSLGGKGVLWELFSFNPPSLRLYVDLCAYSPFLSDLLTGNPGMIDGLMDSLVLDRLPELDAMRRELDELCRAAEDIGPILQSFKNDRTLGIGVREMLGKEDVLATTGALSDVAEVCLEQIIQRQHQQLVARFGRPCPMAVVALGKFGGREMNYHSDLDLIFLYQSDGQTQSDAPGAPTTANQHFFSELGQRIIKAAGRSDGFNRLYEIDVRLRPTGRSGALALSLDEFARYFAGGGGRLWERQALCKARVVFGSPEMAAAAMDAIAHAAFDHPWRVGDAAEIRRMRRRLENTAGGGDLKRGPGGIVDIEFIVQMLQLKHAGMNPALRQPNPLSALEALGTAGLLAEEDRELFARGYRLLRTIEGRLRLINSSARDRLPGDPVELSRLAGLLRYSGGDALLKDYETMTAEIRRRFDWLVNQQDD